nr:MAG TPA: hypothetical protein [Bacteriophage sp.]
MIICAAIKDTTTGAIFGGIRHGFIYTAMHDAGINPPHALAVEGFLDEMGNFYDRYEAYTVAMNNGQMSATARQYKRDKGEIELYSEDLY